MSLEDSVNEVLRTVGRNMILFQQLEHLLKYIVANGQGAGYASELKNIQVKRTSLINKQTMGQLVSQYIETSNPDYVEILPEPEDITEGYYSFRFNFETDLIYYETKKETLSQLVSERNELVHHLLPNFDTSSAKSCNAIEETLDIQSEKIRSEIKEMKATANAIHKERKKIYDFLGSEEGKKHYSLFFLRQSPIVLLLGDIANQIRRTDGWTSMSIAGQLIKQHAPEERALLKKNHGYKSLKSLILATELFDIYEEGTEKGGIRVYYKIKSGWVLSFS